ncbi:MAG: UDP-N-acetylmuramoyl-tripeptide--D-alanyl-D-alanine ligase [Patescibacteria group bacterium]
MKKLGRELVLKILNTLARRRIPAKATIVGITGSVGKTTAKDAAAQILAARFKILANAKSLNSEFGVPLTLLGEKSGFANPLAWTGILARAFLKSFTKISTDKIVLELGVDKPGDFAKFFAVIQPEIGVWLNVAPVHLAPGQFASLQEIAQEKRQLIENLPKNGIAILNADDKFARATKTKARKIFFGLSARADLRASSVRENCTGLSAKITWQKEAALLSVPIIGQQNLPSLLAALAVGLASGVSLKAGVAALKNFHLAPGRFNLLAGIHGAKIIDGTYNSNPQSLAAGLAAFAKLKAKRKIFVGGQMNELGANSAKLHRAVAAKIKADLVVGVFGDAKFFVAAARKRKIPSKFFATAEAAGIFLRKELRAGDLVFLKGSQNKVRLEKTVTTILANPADRQLLCRQELAWKKY